MRTRRPLPFSNLIGSFFVAALSACIASSISAAVALNSVVLGKALLAPAARFFPSRFCALASEEAGAVPGVCCASATEPRLTTSARARDARIGDLELMRRIIQKHAGDAMRFGLFTR